MLPLHLVSKQQEEGGRRFASSPGSSQQVSGMSTPNPNQRDNMASSVAETLGQTGPAASLEDQTLILFARLMEGGREDDETCLDLDSLTKLLNEDAEAQQRNKEHPSICKLIDSDCVDTLVCYLDMRQDEVVRGHAILTTSAYLKAAGDEGANALKNFFFDRVNRGTYDDYIVAFCVASQIFPIVPDITSQLFLSEGFLPSLGPLMKRKWKSRKVETACLEMLNAACMNQHCREAIQKYCVEFLEEIVDQEPTEVVRSMNNDPNLHSEGGSISMRRHSEQVQNLAAVILAKLRAVPTKPSATDGQSSRVEEAVSTMEDLSGLFTRMILQDDSHARQHSIEGLAYASLQAPIKESIAKNEDLLKRLVTTLSEAKPKSSTTYGVLSIFCNLTRYQPALTKEQKKMAQLKAYANAAGKLPGQDPLEDDEHVALRCKAVFDAGVTPVLVTHSKNGSPASLALIIGIVHALAVTKALRAPLAQQGAIKLLLQSWIILPETEDAARRTAAQALARILISTNPALVFGGNRANAINTAIRPLVSILPPDPAAEVRDLLPSFEALMALTNLASLEDGEVRRSIISVAWPQIEEQLLSSNALVTKAAVELVCNLMQSPEGIALYADGSPQAKNRLHILLALADAEDEGTRSAAGGALASLTGFESVVLGILAREGGVKAVLGMCVDDNEDLRHRGVYTVYNMVMAEGTVGEQAREKIKDADGVDTMKECLKKSRRPEVLQATVQGLKALLGQS
ncbi:myosin-binding striated muscle assembly central-domain-containing protein [Emericellopsis atlantica]|uniref:Myosin-binding striated muscle assembly central-domain-containing protein n=1 Tax=Emericellopsis atlantica TaxID=2614577 RepID=A0A9P8CUG2_9HYPO|nr:myosin-binding striated muscle assembly central-domain-containing protein [Emericellopsis atlantica]KAG9257581.1 myosin-binding striated muscle assembly central-domain-containing protein [Emericellopsis atlantica]